MDKIQNLANLEPKEVLKYFYEICSIPHGSGNVKMISDYLVEFAKEHKLYYRQDELFNVIIKKPATVGYEDRPAVIIQGHIDMVSVKTAECNKDLEKEGLDLDYENGFLYAKGTSLGADDGIAVAYALAILASDVIEHPALEVLLTTDEEIGMFGATALELSDIESRIMLNIDSEEEGIFLAGCAGGAQVVCNIPIEYEKFSGCMCDVSLTGFTGGHSGVEIICQRANANVLLGRILYNLSKNVDFRIVSVDGGEKDNAIATFSDAKIVVAAKDTDTLRENVISMFEVIKSEYVTTDPNISVKVNIEDLDNHMVCDMATTKRVVTALNCMPNGILKMSNDISGLVQTSLNLGILKTVEGKVLLSYSVRSAVSSEKAELIDRLECLTKSLLGYCEISGDYPAWEYQRESRLREIMCETYKDMYGEEPKVQTIHAGLECGIIADKLPGLDCISFGPDIKDIHTTKERLDIASTERTWKLILEVLKRI